MSDLSPWAIRLRSVISEKRLDDIGREVGFCQRKRLLDATHAVWVFVVGLAGGSGPRVLAGFVRLFTVLSGKTIAYKAFHDRINRPEFPEFLRRVVEEAMARLCVPTLRAGDRLLKRFEDIVLHDGSSFALPASLKGDFPGRFTAIKPAAVEVHATLSLFTGQITNLSIAPDKEGERQFLPDARDLENKLLLIDAGYLSNDVFSTVDESGGYFVCRAGKSFNPRIVRPVRGCMGPQVVGKKLRDLRLGRRNYDFIVETKRTDGQKFQWRVVVFYSAKKKKHTFLVTNLGARDFRVARVAELYRLRWQVELFFKECKSYTGLKSYSTGSPYIVEGLIWGTMLTVMLRRFLAFCALRNQNKMPAFFTAASLGWTYFQDLAIAALRADRRFLPVLKEKLALLAATASRTNPRRADSFKALNLEVRYGCG